MEESPYKLFLTKFNDFTEVNKLSIGPIEQGYNCLITAPTGSGKTEAAILPILNKISKAQNKLGIYALYVTPTRSLNRDLIKRLEWLGSKLGISIAVRHGDTTQSERKKQRLSPPQLLITTPETIQNLLLSKALRKSLENLKTVIVDEVHELYYNKRGAQLSIALERLEEISNRYQRIGISATIGDVSEASNFLFNGLPHKNIASTAQKQIEITVEMPQKPKHDDKEFRLSFGLDLPAYARITRVTELIKSAKAAIIFANTRQAVESIGSKLILLEKTTDFGKVGIHHSSIDKDERIKTENAFKSGNIKAIIATSSLELGIDVGEIDLVVQYGSPKQVTRLIQRVGRGGHRQMAKSVGIVIAHNELDCLESVAIAEDAISLKLEKHKVERCALDVLANQICAMTMEYGKIGKNQAFKIVTRSFVYKELKEADFARTCNLLSDLRLIKQDSESISSGSRGRNYFINAISVIPDTTRFIVKEVVENKIISTLDEEFVYNYIDQGSVFITKGLPWKVVSIEENAILVESSDDMSAAIPDWDGEDIPVSRDIASKVWRYLQNGMKTENAMVESHTLAEISTFIQENSKYFVPEENTIIIEELDNCAIAYMPTGKLTNEFIARIASIMASSHSGAKVNARATPYAIIFDYSSVIRRPDTLAIFKELKNIRIEDKSFIFDTDLFRYKFVQTAKLFGVVEKKTTVTKSMANRLISFYESSPIFDETVRDLYKNYFDMGVTKGIIEDIKSDSVRIELAEKTPSPISKAILQSVFKYGELLSTPERSTVIDKMFDKFDGRSIKMICTFCGHIFNEKINMNSSGKLLCTSCKSPLIAIYGDKYEELIKKRISQKPFREKDNAIYKEMMKEASMVDAYGSRALVSLSVYGIGIETASRLLRYIRKDYKMFFVDIIDAQRNFIKNRKFWKID
ncbi:MAG: DEAD/DEAH box helicase [Candidatus Micrarchaeaceae archaeon]